MELGLAGKVALVGGGSRGLGRAVAASLAREGADVAVFARDERALATAAEEIDAMGTHVTPIAADVSRPDDCLRVVERTVEALGGLDVLVTNMGGPPYGAASARTDAEWQQAWELVTMGVVRLCRAAVPHMRERGGGAIVGITTSGVHQLIAGTALSSVARMATTGYTKYLAAELAAENIRVNNVLPGWIATQRVVDLAEAEAAERDVTVEDVYREQNDAIPMARFGDAREIADAVVFLASERASYITGVNLRVDGGWCLNTTF